jgi:hypothetical protein
MRKILVSGFVSICLVLALPALAQTTNTSTDLTKPTISGVTVGSITKTSALITWTTNEASTSYVDYGITDVYTSLAGNGSYALSHSVTASDLIAGTLYHFRVRSKDAAGNEAVSTDTTFTSTGTAVNTNTAVTNTNTTVVVNGNTNTNKNSNTNATVVVNTNTTKNTNKNSNKNTNLNTNSSANKNQNTNSAPDENTNSLFNQNTNETVLNANTEDLNANLTENANVIATDSTSSNDGRAGVALIIGGVVILLAVVIIVWIKVRRSKPIQP